MNKNPIKIGIIGIGAIGTKHARSIHEGKIANTTLAAICGTSSERSKINATGFPDAAFFDDTKTMMSSGLVDAVIICTPNYNHSDLTLLAFKHGLHVLCEKPMAIDAKSAKEVIEAHEQNPNLVFAMMYNQRTNPLHIKMREIIQSGELGNMRRFTWLVTNIFRPQSYYDEAAWRGTWREEGGGVLINQGIHNLDLWQWMLGMPKSIRAFCHESKWHNMQGEDDVTAYAEYEGGATGVFVISTGEHPGINRLEISFDKGKLLCEDGRLFLHKMPITLQEFSANSKEMFDKPECNITEILPESENTQHIGIIENFVCKILGQGELVAHGTEGINGLMLSNAMHLSSWTDMAIKLPLDTVDTDMFYKKLQSKITSDSDTL